MKDFKVFGSKIRYSTSGAGEGRYVTSSRSISTYGAQLSAITTARVKYRR